MEKIALILFKNRKAKLCGKLANSSTSDAKFQ